MTSTTSSSYGIAVLAAASLFALGPSLPASAAAPKGPTQREDGASTRTERPDPNEMICVRAALSGSRLIREICHTRREWQLDGGVPTADDR
jgi:hypothetical protein